MFTTTASVPINSGVEPTLTPQQVWQGLVIRARNEDERFVPPGHRFELVQDNGDQLVRRVHLADGRVELQHISFHGERLMVFDFVEGPQLGLIFCVIETDADGEFCLRMTFLTEFAHLAHGSAEEAAFAAHRRPLMMGQPPQVLDVIRELVKEGTLA